MLYAITAQVHSRQGEWTGSRQIPTFYLDSSVQGITSPDHALVIATMILDPFGQHSLSVHAEPVPDPTATRHAAIARALFPEES